MAPTFTTTQMGITRTRPTSVCLFCRQRKVRCNKEKPCSTCVKYGNKHCIYQSFPHDNIDLTKLNRSELNNLLNKLKRQATDIVKRIDKNGPLEPKISPEMTMNDDVGLSAAVNNDNDGINVTPSNAYGNDNFIDEIDHIIDDSKINLFQQYETVDDHIPIRRRHISPLSSKALVRSDPLFFKIWNVVFDNITKLKSENMSLSISETNYLPENFKIRLQNYEQFRQLKETSDESIRNEKFKLNEKSKKLGLMFFEGEMTSDFDLISKIKLILPNKKVIDALLTKFYNELYPFFAIVDQNTCNVEFSRLLQYENILDETSMVKNLHVEHKLDFAYLGILLMILRISYLGLFSNIQAINEYNLNNSTPNEDQTITKYLLNNPISLEVVHIAQICLNQFNLINASNLVVLQLAMLVRDYKVFGPESGAETESGEPQVFSALLMQTAYSLGLHREPGYFNLTNKDEKLNNLGRKIWHLLCSMDIWTSCRAGDPTSIKKFSADVKFPYATETNGNVDNIVLEKVISNVLRGYPKELQNFNEIFEIITDVNSSFEIKDVAKRCYYTLKAFLDNSLPSIEANDNKDLNLPVRYYYKTYKLKYFFAFLSTTLSLDLQFLSYYEKQGKFNQSTFFLRHCLHLVYETAFPKIGELLITYNQSQKDVCELIVTPSMEHFIYLSLLLNLGLLVRVNLIMNRSMSTLSSKWTVFRQLLLDSTESLQKFMNLLGNRYFHTWQMSKVAQLFLKEIDSSDNDQLYLDVEIIDNLGLTDDKLQQFIDIIEYALKQHEIMHYQNINNENYHVFNTNDQSPTNYDNDSLWLLLLTLRRQQPNSSHITSPADDQYYNLNSTFEIEDPNPNPYLDEIFLEFLQR